VDHVSSQAALAIPGHHPGSSLLNFRDLGWDHTFTDDQVWTRCQAAGLILITANRNMDGPDSLEATLRRQNQSDSLPVYTISNAKWFLLDDDYARRVADRHLDDLYKIKQYLGAGRLYVP